MWHTEEIARIFDKMVNDYGYDIFLDRKKCVGLSGDLLSKYSVEKKIMQMLFQAGLGEAFIGAPFKSEQELKMGLLRVETFLEQQAIELETRMNVIEIVQLAFTDWKGEQTFFKSIIAKNFNDVHFKMSIPRATDYSDKLQFSFDFFAKKMEERIDTILEKCVITDKLNRVHTSQMDYTLILSGKGGKTKINIPHGEKSIFMRDAKVEFTFLCSNKRRIVTSYISGSDHKLSLKQIEIFQMSDNEYEKTQNIVQLLNKTKEDAEKDISNMSSKVEVGDISVVPNYTSSDIQEYSDALSKEILFLKMGKGKKYKIVNGVKINKDKGIYTYLFELETELHLPDDAPVVVDTASGFHAVGTVLLCEDFQIMLLIDRDLNDKVSSAYLMVEPWKLLEALDKRMTSLNPNTNRIAVKLMEEGPKLSTAQDIANIPKGQDTVMNKLEQDDIVTVWGPPGTGKTYTMAQIAKKYIANGKSVLIVSHSNVSVDGVVKSVVNMLDSNMQSLLRAGKILRFGYVRDDELSKHPHATSFNYALSNCPDLSYELDSLSKRREELRAKKQTKSAEYDVIEKKIKKIREKIRKEERYYVEKAQLIGTTISRATVDPMFEERQFDLVMFDEVSMAYVPQVIAAAALAKEKFLCVGDFRQLAPIAQGNDSKKVLQIDIFSYLQIVDSLGNMYWHPWLVMLDEQRRMHPDISAFPNRFVYKNLLKNHVSVNHKRDSIVAMEPLAGDAVNLIDLAGTYCAASKNNDNSRFNILSAIISFSTAVKAEKEGAESVGIITPYAAQTRLIRAMLKDYYNYGRTVITCATVHQFQGSESDVLIFDAVESYPGGKVGFLMGKVPNEVVRLINVAITRAKGKLITVANARFWENAFKGTNHVFYKLLRHIQDKHTVINHADKGLKPYIEKVAPDRMINIFTDEKNAIEVFEKDMMRASGRVIISIPDGELRETAFKVWEIIDEVDSKGVNVLMKSNDYQSLPDDWKKFCFGTENAVFPLIIIDDEVAWYGLPTSKLKFKVDKSLSFNTVVHTMVRIQGKNTIEMIKSLTDIEVVQVGNNVRPLVPKKGKVSSISSTTGSNGKSDDGMLGAQGLAEFIEEKEFCPECKNHMKLAKNAKGTFYIRCSAKTCKHMEYLTPELMNWYIRSKNVTCPHGDGGELTGILGKYGPCIRCNRGHFLKADEI